MSLEAAILTHTEDNVALVSNRVYAFDSVPNGTAAPYIAFGTVSNDFSHSLGGDSGYCKTRIQFSVFAQTPESAKAVISELKGAYRNMASVDWSQASLLDNEVTQRKPDDTALYHTTLDVFFMHIENI